jgi:hypothetical protein
LHAVRLPINLAASRINSSADAIIAAGDMAHRLEVACRQLLLVLLERAMINKGGALACWLAFALLATESVFGKGIPARREA